MVFSFGCFFEILRDIMYHIYMPITKETLKNDPISLSSPSERVFFDQSARFKRFLGSFWAPWLAQLVLYPILGAVTPQAASKAFLAMIRLARAKSTSCWAPFFLSPW